MSQAGSPVVLPPHPLVILKHRLADVGRPETIHPLAQLFQGEPAALPCQT